MTTSSKSPILDIVMLVHARPDWAELAIKAVENFTKNPYRLILVDNASVPGMKPVLADAEDRGHTIVRLAANKSFSNGVNAGVAAGNAKFICILNDDAIVTDGWDTAMIQDATPKHVGMVGAQSNYVTGPQGNPGFIGKTPYLIFVCVALRRNVWDAIGPMDEVTFDGFSSEDLDYSWRVTKAGFELVISKAYVLHGGSRTLAVTAGDVNAQIRNNQKYNARLLDKWGPEWMKAHGATEKRGLVVSYSAEEWTRVAFMGSLIRLRKSDGVGFSFHHMTRAPIHYARNAVADFALDQGFDWLIQLDDDATFPDDVVRRLLTHDKEVVTALAYQRKPPYLPCIYECNDNVDQMIGRPLEGVEHTGLRRVDVSGFHVSVIQTSVIKKLRDAGIRQYYGGFDNKVGEDFAMCLNLKKVGVKVHCDTGLIAGHLGASVEINEEYRKRYLAGTAP